MFYKIGVLKNFEKLTGKQLCPGFLLIKLQVSILQLYGKNRIQYRCFIINFTRYLRHIFYRTPPGDCVCPTEKYFTNKIVKILLKKEKKNWKLLVRKTTTLFSLFPMIHWKHLLLETMQSHWGFIYNRKLFLNIYIYVIWLWFQQIQESLWKQIKNAWNRKTALKKIIIYYKLRYT